MVFIPSCANDAERADYLRAEERNLLAREDIARRVETQLTGWEKRLAEREANIVERERLVQAREKEEKNKAAVEKTVPISTAMKGKAAPKEGAGQAGISKAKKKIASMPVKNSFQFWLCENRERVHAELVQHGLPTVKLLQVAGEQWRALEDRSRWKAMMEAEGVRVRKLREQAGVPTIARKKKPSLKPSAGSVEMH